MMYLTWGVRFRTKAFTLGLVPDRTLKQEKTLSLDGVPHVWKMFMLRVVWLPPPQLGAQLLYVWASWRSVCSTRSGHTLTPWHVPQLLILHWRWPQRPAGSLHHTGSSFPPSEGHLCLIWTGNKLLGVSWLSCCTSGNIGKVSLWLDISCLL